MQIGSVTLPSEFILAPMAGVTDRPFRQLCRNLGAGMAVSEMVSADKRLRTTRKTRLRLDHEGEADPVVVQIAGADPQMLAEAARFNVDQGASLIDINMGCPKKKVCNVMAGSALLKDECLVARILAAVVNAVPVPVTLKIRSGWDRHNRNALGIARLAEQSGIQALVIHGRTRADGFAGSAEHDSCRRVKRAVSIPVVVNGDIRSAQEAVRALNYTGADAVMIGRAALGNPWIFRECTRFLSTGTLSGAAAMAEVRHTLLVHLDALYSFYGAYSGVRIARKHVGWYVRGSRHGGSLCRQVNMATTPAEQLRAVHTFFAEQPRTALAA